MTAIRNLFAGRYPLRVVFWFIGLPVYAIHHVAVGCGLADRSGCGIESLTLGWLALVTVIGTLLLAIPIWRSASNYAGPRSVTSWAHVYVVFTLSIALPMSLATGYALAYTDFAGRW